MTAELSFDPAIPVADPDSETDELIYRLSHDLRASVRALQELPTWIEEDLTKAALALPPPSARHLQMISSHASRLDHMLTGLLEYSRVGRMQPIAALTPAAVLAEVLEDLALPGRLSVRTKLDRGRIQMGHTDLKRLFSIPIVNAVRFHPAKSPRIEITGGPDNDREWIFEVSDDGPGIPPDKVEYVQRPMTKLVSRDVDPGAGMGLAILKKIAFAYGGNVEIGPAKGTAGTRVRVRVAVN